MSALQLPYAFLVASLLLFEARIDATPIVWICLAVALLEVIFLPFLRDDDSL